MMSFRQNLRLFLWARAQHRLRQTGRPVKFSAAAELIAGATGVDLHKVRAALGGGFSSRATQDQLARWCGLRCATKHGAPVLVADLSETFERGPDRVYGPVAGSIPGMAAGGGIAPFQPEELRRRLTAVVSKKIRAA
ncbi:hypothetical protein [Roseibium alexandrii]|uniref:Uncharacterized protein n=1 Tax=Roseibium alexandrii (strain DSM 17067 / NCIMB 14079 / DFL-11) TaxID=244592 RepID=A0A5E8GT55_ROSAD|nr:hypothetical protein [Roseibium alexandrii]EEE43034.2 hypothetical protein SADFL11_320 [Roseibium alexandrii DFL-11]